MSLARRLLAAAALFLLAEATAHAAATVVIDNGDGAGQGLNDPAPFSPTGGNTATTLGAARLAVFQTAASIWGAHLTSAVPIHVRAMVGPLSCTTNTAVLASTGPQTVHRDFPGAPAVGTWYAQALANSLAGADLDPSSPDIATTFNGGLGVAACLPATTWYLGLDGHPGSGQIDMLTVLLHELAHGLGFLTFDNLTTGEKLLGLDDTFMLNVRELGVTPTGFSDMTDAQRVSASLSDPNLYWAGANVQGAVSTLSAGLTSGHVRMHAPATLAPGSSVSHFSTALSPNQLMEPNYTGPTRDVTLTLDLLRDIGWKIDSTPPSVPAGAEWSRWALALALGIIAVRALGRRSVRPAAR